MSRSPDWADTLSRRREGQGLSHGPPGALQVGRPGVTLLELIVVLAVLGLILAIATPMFMIPPRGPVDDEIALARRMAVIRGEPVTVVVNGTRVHITPLGVCIPETAPSSSRATWDAIGCRTPGGLKNDSGPLKSKSLKSTTGEARAR